MSNVLMENDIIGQIQEYLQQKYFHKKVSVLKDLDIYFSNYSIRSICVLDAHAQRVDDGNHKLVLIEGRFHLEYREERLWCNGPSSNAFYMYRFDQAEIDYHMKQSALDVIFFNNVSLTSPNMTSRQWFELYQSFYEAMPNDRYHISRNFLKTLRKNASLYKSTRLLNDCHVEFLLHQIPPAYEDVEYYVFDLGRNKLVIDKNCNAIVIGKEEKEAIDRHALLLRLES